MKKYKVSELVLDFDVYPRGQVDSQHAGYIAAAIEAGVELPPGIICKKTKRIVDGAHRHRALRHVYGDDATMECIERTYKTEAALLLDAIRLNAHHGRCLTQFDRTRCITLAQKLEIDDTLLADAMSVKVDKLAELRTDRTAQDATLTIPIKRTIQHMAGQKLTKRQVEANGRLSGMNQAFYVNQLIELIESDMLNTADAKLMARIERLQELLSGLIVAA
jgi:hypothetical protein